MYSTKLFHPKVAESYLSLGDPYERSSGANPRWKGRQFQSGSTNPYFGKFEYFGGEETFMDTNNYRTTQPRENRKLGFGSMDASRRDEFALDVKAQQYKELLERESYFMTKFTTEQPERQKESGEIDALDLELRRLNSRENDSKLFQTRVPTLLYDIGKEVVVDPDGSISSGVTPTCMKCGRETFYCKHRVNAHGSESLRRKGQLRTTSEIIGQTGLVVKPANGRRLKLQDFYDNNHLSVNQRE